jgi:hypothetical protein
MEHREPPRVGPGDGQIDESAELPAGRFRLRRFEAAGTGRQIDYRRVGFFLVVGSATLVGLVYFSAWAARTSVGWLAQQPQYQIPFDQIELVPKPPRWYERGSQAFLEGVRLGSREPDHLSVLDLAPDALTAAFKKYAWVNQVTRITYPPGRIRVELRYRQPVAWVQLRGAQQRMIDDEATVLPTDNIDVKKLGRVVKITCIGGLPAPSATQFGEKWKSKADENSAAEVDERIVAAAKLAGFLLQEPQATDAERSLALRLDEINVSDFENRGLFVINAERAAILWDDAPGDEKPGRPTASDKWAILKHWEESTPARFLESGDYWAFGKTDLYWICPPSHVRHRPKTASERPVGSWVTKPKSAKSG